jgi:signal transduction histidine kinase
LGAILSNTETMELLLESPTPDMAEFKTILSDIKRADQRASDVIKRLRGFLSKGEIKSRDFDLNAIVGDVIEIMSAQASARGVTLDTVLSHVPLIVKGDRVQLEQVILNLVANAIDALAETPNIKRRIRIRTQALDDGLAELSVSDAGPGIPPNVLNHIFDPFFTTKSGGMGMGLAISRTIVGAHNGRIEAQNQAGGGATFLVTLPTS